MSIENKENKRDFYLITIIPEGVSGGFYAIGKINSFEFKLYDFNFWKWRILYPALRVYRFICVKNFEDNLREILEIVQEKENENKNKLNYLLERRD
ncbi:MAG: hypothetical protein ACTSRG_20195 [Candidatus Helarchaeota archaeon]